MNDTEQTIGVIGAGLGGLAAACVLAARGYSVTLFEGNRWFGGKAAVLEEQGFRFDMGPTILTVPAVLKRIFAEAHKDIEEVLDLVRLDPQWRCFFEDGSILDLHENLQDMRGTLEEFSGTKTVPEGYQDFVKLSERLHEISQRFFLWRPIEDLRDTLDLKSSFNLSTLKDVLSLRMGQSVASVIRSRIRDPRVAQMLDHFVQYVGSSPYNAPAVLCSIAHMQLDGGVWYPKGGTRAVPRVLKRLATELGVDMHPCCEVSKILVENSHVVGVETETGETISLAAVVSNMDSVRTYTELVGGATAERFSKRRRYEPACSGVVLYLGLKEAYDHLLHHNFVFSQDPEEEFDWIYNKGKPAPDPTCYLAAPARTEPEVAPPGGEALYVLVHTPYLRQGHDWKEMLPTYRKTIIDKLARCAGMGDIEDRIVFEAALTPQDIHERYRVLNGAIYGLASHGRFVGAFKPGNRCRDLKGLYLAGGAANPGPGMPMVLMSGWIAANTLDRDGIVAKRKSESHFPLRAVT